MKNKQKGIGGVALILIIAFVFVLIILGGIALSVSSGNKKGGSSTDGQLKIGKEEIQSWQRIESGQKGFSMRIPDGWVVANHTPTDAIRTSIIGFDDGERPVIENIASDYPPNVFVRFQVLQFKEASNLKFVFGDEEKSSFKAGGIEGARYYKKFPAEPSRVSGLIPGEEQYIYEFRKSGKVVYAVYRILNKNQYSEEYLKTTFNQETSDPNRVELIEHVLRTLTIN